jgi:hypothetical protein
MIDRLIEIGRRYGMEMNVEKTNVMRISRPKSPIKITMHQKQLKNVEEKVLEIERGRTRSHPVENSLWKRLRTSHKTDYRMNECSTCSRVGSFSPRTLHARRKRPR